MMENILDATGLVRTRPTGFDIEASSVDADGAAVVRLQGEVDMSAAPRMIRHLTTTLDASPQTVAVELGEVTFLDSTGLRALIATHHRAVSQGCAFILRSPRASVLKVLKLTGMDRVMLIDERLDGVVRAQDTAEVVASTRTESRPPQ